MKRNPERILQKLMAILAILVVSVAILPHLARAEYFTIGDFHADITIHDDASLTIVETIDVRFTHARHGIFRAMPYKYTDELGAAMRTPINVMAVKDETGRKRPYKVTREHNEIRVRIGDADRYVSGRQVYIIEYEVENAMLFLENHDELYWNVTGNNWPAPIAHASALVKFATGNAGDSLRTDCYTGRYGSNHSDCTVDIHADQTRYETTEPLRVAEGLTVVLGFDKGLVTQPSAFQQFIWDYNLGATWVIVIPFIVFVFMFFRWRGRGRDPKVRQSVVVKYEPPSSNGRQLTAAEVGTLIDEKLDQRDITAAIIGLAVKGYLRISEKKVSGMVALLDSMEYRLEKVKESDSNMTPFEKTLMTSLFRDSQGSIYLSALEKKFYKDLPRLNQLQYSGLTSKGFFSDDPSKVRQKYAGFGIIVTVIGVALSFGIASDAILVHIAASVLTGAAIFVFASAMPARTRAGAVAKMDALGFQEFMTRADKDRLERMGTGIFYEYLPYAMALNVSDQWATAFEGLFKEPPDWYVSAGGFRNFSPIMFNRSLTTATNSMTTAMYSAPRGGGGGGGGGGFSGGGGGGGGGGSW